MATETTTTYRCDGCEKPKQRRDLRKFRLTERKMDGSVVADADTELCSDCERALHENAKAFWPADEWEALEGIVR